jgi:hypothetical protein
VTVLYGSDVADATLTTACDMATTTGGTETSQTSSGTGVNIYQEVYSKGGSPASVGAIPATPTGNGWVFKQASAGTYPLGNWSASITFSSTFTGVSLTLRFFKYSSGTYTSIGTITVSLTGSAKTTYSFAATSMPATTFLSSDLLYIDLWFLDNNSNISGDNPIIYESTSATQGVANDMQITTTTFGTGSTTQDRKFSSRLFQFTQAPKKIASRLRQFAQAPKKVTSRLFQLTQDSRKLISRLFQFAKKSRIVSSRFFQSAVDVRKYPVRLFQYAKIAKISSSRFFQLAPSPRKIATRFFQGNQIIKKWANRFLQFAKQSRVFSTRFVFVISSLAQKTFSSRLYQWSRSPKEIGTRLLHFVLVYKIAITRFSQYGQVVKKTTARFFQLAQQNRKTATRLFSYAAIKRATSSRLFQLSQSSKKISTRFLQVIQQKRIVSIRLFQNIKSDRVIASRFFQKALTQVQKSVTTRFFQTNASGNISDSSAPSLYYMMNGVVLDTPITAIQPPLQGGNILQGSCFILVWQYPSSATQVAMANRSTGSAQFFCNGSLVTAPVFVESSVASNVLVATITVMATVAISTSVIQTQFY